MAIAWCFQDEQTPAIMKVRNSLECETALVPGLMWDLEVWNALLVARRLGRIRSIEDNARLLAALAVKRVAAPLDHVLALAVKHGLSSYDALYLGLAVERRLPLATLDAKLAQATRAERLEVLGG